MTMRIRPYTILPYLGLHVMLLREARAPKVDITRPRRREKAYREALKSIRSGAVAIPEGHDADSLAGWIADTVVG